MFQGNQEIENKNEARFPFDLKKLNTVIVTHSHLDHVGRLPLLVTGGYEGEIYMTPPTAELARLILDDAVAVMSYEQRKYGRTPLYGMEEVEKTIAKFTPTEYGQEVAIRNSKRKIGSFIYHEAGHIFGSAFVEIRINKKKIIFSGDLGNTDVPILRDTDLLPKYSDFVVCESTYGGRIHEAKNNKEREKLIEKKIRQAMRRGGDLMIPSFALERTQQLLYVLNNLIERKKNLPRLPIFLDSPLAIRATEVYRRFPKYYNEQAAKLYKVDDDLFNFPGLTVCLSKEESKKINSTKGSKIIIAGAGMMNGGRILHHAKRYLSYKQNTLLFIGYQAHGTLGRKILEGANQVEIMGDKIPVKCHIEAIGALSAHADQEKIIDWLGGGKTLPKKVIFNHGEPDQSIAVAARIEAELGIEVDLLDETTVFT